MRLLKLFPVMATVRKTKTGTTTITVKYSKKIEYSILEKAGEYLTHRLFL